MANPTAWTLEERVQAVAVSGWTNRPLHQYLRQPKLRAQAYSHLRKNGWTLYALHHVPTIAQDASVHLEDSKDVRATVLSMWELESPAVKHYYQVRNEQFRQGQEVVLDEIVAGQWTGSKVTVPGVAGNDTMAGSSVDMPIILDEDPVDNALEHTADQARQLEAAPSLTLSERFRLLGLATFTSDNALEEALRGSELRTDLAKKLNRDGRTLYAVKNAHVLVQLSAAATNQATALLTVNDCLWDTEIDRVKVIFETRTREFCKGSDVILEYGDGDFITLPALFDNTVGLQQNAFQHNQLELNALQQRGLQHPNEIVTETRYEENDVVVIIPEPDHIWSLAERMRALNVHLCDEDSCNETTTCPEHWKLEGLNHFSKWFWAVGVVPELYAKCETGGRTLQSNVRRGVEMKWHEMLAWQKLAFVQESERVLKAGFNAVLECLGLEPASNVMNGVEEDVAEQGVADYHFSARSGYRNKASDDQHMSDAEPLEIQEHNESMHSPTPEHRGPLQPATLVFPKQAYMHRKFLRIDLQDIVNRYKPEKLLRLSEMFEHGRDLFDFHIYPIIGEYGRYSADSREAVQLAGRIWASMPQEVEHQWHEGFCSLRKKCRAGNPTGLFKLGTYGCLKGEVDYHFLAYSQYVPHVVTSLGKMLATSHVDLVASGGVNVSTEPLILDALLYNVAPSLPKSEDRVQLFEQILTAIRWHLNRLQNNRMGLHVQVRGRTWNGMLVSYDTLVEGRRGIKNQLLAVMAASSSEWDIELLLRPLAQWNLNAPFVPKLVASGRQQLFSNAALVPKPDFQEVWQQWPGLQRAIRPVTKERRADIASIVLDFVVGRCMSFIRSAHCSHQQ